ncbi:copper chaperone PCu(A)C [Marinobacter sp. X15-166B]|uniref:copper chaperone PCu(A)C n=1 Tax=Marinobacter sp. X15-166B TaxID=1897620 RepID=UPI00085BE19C|nr:copper chaperone PCu(A)C [Marinobacter sp. X15-166B]OEY66938.1 hypothetical protein BG841_11060 [Marinobacter sp. X15-166B]
MKRMCVAVLALLMTVWMPAALHGHEYHSGNLHIDHPWSRPTPPGVSMGVGYMVISNRGEEAATLIAATSPRAGHISIHQTRMTEGVMRMQPLEKGLVIPAGAAVVLEPLGYHLMLEQLVSTLVEGERIPVTLEFAGGQQVQVELAVDPLDDTESEAMDHSHH